MNSQEICQRPKFISEGATRFDVEQGEQGDPWLLAAVSSLTLTPRFLDRVVPPDQVQYEKDSDEPIGHSLLYTYMYIFMDLISVCQMKFR